ncbi:hypothetical protein OHB44_09735 [Micromonospora sp. NBC_00821]|uniref:hypothetical protein n=1 Tax=Micromonospora sp. NBC_00821 TaxID=2975977 RepID=UPI002ED39F58|nr:hypothetical protein OHB44_09735 [Micromonospora sp. NBC_00821]
MHLLVDRPVGGELPAGRRQQMRRDDRMRHQRWDQQGMSLLATGTANLPSVSWHRWLGDYSEAAAMTPA